MEKVVILLLALVLAFTGCDGNIDSGNSGFPANPEDIPVETIPTGPMFRGDLSEIGVDSNGLITFADYQEFLEFREKYFITGEGEKLILSTMWCSQDMKPEYQLEYDRGYQSLRENYYNSQDELIEAFENGSISTAEYYSQLEILTDEYNAKKSIFDMEFAEKKGIWGEVRIEIVGKNLSSEPVSLYMVGNTDNESFIQFLGPVEFSVLDEWQGYIYRFDYNGDLYPEPNILRYMEI